MKQVYEDIKYTDFLAKRLQQVRIEKGINKETFASVLGVSCALIDNYERGVEISSINTLLETANIFQVSFDYLFGYADESLNFVIQAYKNMDDKEKLGINFAFKLMMIEKLNRQNKQ